MQLSDGSPAPGPTAHTRGALLSPYSLGDPQILQMGHVCKWHVMTGSKSGQLLPTQRSRQALLSKLWGQGLSVFKKPLEM